jgi:hypothetical protein
MWPDGKERKKVQKKCKKKKIQKEEIQNKKANGTRSSQAVSHPRTIQAQYPGGHVPFSCQSVRAGLLPEAKCWPRNKSPYLLNVML